VLLVLGLILCLPIAGLLLFKFYANQLVQQTEESLLSQAAVMSAVYAQAVAGARGLVTDEAPELGYAPAFPSLSLSRDTILPPRPDAQPVNAPPDALYRDLGPTLSQIARDAQRATLAGYRFVDPNGTVIAGSAELGVSLAHVPEVAEALAGRSASVARVRLRDTPEPFLYEFSRGTRVRVFVAMPTMVQDEVVGAVYISRTPNHIFRFLYGERFNLLKAALFVVLSTGLIGFVFWRFITRPIHALIRQTQGATQRHWRWQPVAHLGTREIERLSDSFQTLTERLQAQQEALRSYTAHVTHELKSPLTAAKGATELLRDAEMPRAQQKRFLGNISADIDRMEALLAQMRAFSLADQVGAPGTTDLAALTPWLASEFAGVEVIVQPKGTPLPIAEDALRIVLAHLIGNAAQNGARQVRLDSRDAGDAIVLHVADDGPGISPGNRDKIFTPFFTTRRDSGGTGMGLNIVRSIIEASNGSIALETAQKGASFRVAFHKG
jgi:signal transduction histidine kinase